MPAYVISEVEILDEHAANEYRRIAQESIAQYGGRYLARGVVPDVVEGEGTSRRLVLVEFPSMEIARQWYVSREYAKALAFRDRALDRRLMFFEGVSPIGMEPEAAAS